MKPEQRYIFKRTHKGLRSMLFDAGGKIQQTDFTKSKEPDVAIHIIRQTTRSFLYHLNKEDNLLVRITSVCLDVRLSVSKNQLYHDDIIKALPRLNTVTFAENL